MYRKNSQTPLLALDIDGTLTHGNEPIDPTLILFLEQQVSLGVHLLFITGRTFAWSAPTFEKITCPYALAVQNGALLLQMPNREVVYRKLLSSSTLPKLSEICASEPTGVVVLSGYEGEDRCYYLGDQFDKELLDYCLWRAEKAHETWVALESFEQLPISQFPSVKFFGEESSLKRIVSQVERELDLHIPLTFDPFDKSFRVAQGTRQGVDKGGALLEYQQLHQSLQFFTIAAGDDINDIPLLEAADLAVVVEGAPKEVEALADMRASPPSELGIITALKEILK